MIRRAGMFCAALCITMGLRGGSARGASMVVPGGMADRAGNANNLMPFNPWAPSRMQQVYGSSDFSGLDGPRYISAIAFRSNAFGATLRNFSITMSTTSQQPDGLSPVFSANTGDDAQVVYSGTLPIYATDEKSESAPSHFGLVVNLQRPFLYDPTKGNLLVDFLNPDPKLTVFANGATPTLDAEQVEGDTMSRVLGYVDGTDNTWNPYTVPDLSHGHPDSLGLSTAFLFGGPDPIPQPGIPDIVPEPSSCLILALPALGVVLLRSRSRRPSDAA